MLKKQLFVFYFLNFITHLSPEHALMHFASTQKPEKPLLLSAAHESVGRGRQIDGDSCQVSQIDTQLLLHH
jgi:hypothetical protein